MPGSIIIILGVLYLRDKPLPACRAQKKGQHKAGFLNGAGDEIRTHDPNLGKVMLYP